MHGNGDMSIGKWISALYREFQTYINNEVKDLGICSSEYIYLVTLGSKEGVNLKSLSDELMIDRAETSRIMKSLEKKGFVSREPCPRDGRAVIVRLTDRGRDVQPQIMEKLDVWTGLLSEGMSKKDVMSFIQRLEGMHTRCKNYIHQEIK